MERSTILVRILGCVLVGLGFLAHLSLVPGYLNEENNKRIEIIENKIDIIFFQSFSWEAPDSFRVIEEYQALDSGATKHTMINRMNELFGIVYLVLGVILILFGEYLRSYKLQ